MITSHDPSGAAASAIPHTRRAMRLLLLMLLAASMAIAAPTPPASAAEPSNTCMNNAGDEMQLLSGDFGLPLWLGVQWASNSGEPLVVVCYATAAPADSKTLGGRALIDPQNGVLLSNRSDSNAGAQANAAATVTPSYTVSPGGPSGGQELTFEIPVAVCSGVCYDVPGGGLETTGLIVGSVTQKPAPGGVSAAYEVTRLCLMVNGIAVTDCGSSLVVPGATTTGNSPVNVGTGGSTPGPCVVGVCIPSIDYVGTSGRQLATVFVEGLSPIPVYGVHTCVYQRDTQTPCPT